MTLPAVSNAFERLHERVRRWVWREKWDQLRDVQEAAIEPILSGSKDVIVMAATAAGKTEAAFLPICSRLTGNAGGSVRALYVGPLKALISVSDFRMPYLYIRSGRGEAVATTSPTSSTYLVRLSSPYRP